MTIAVSKPYEQDTRRLLAILDTQSRKLAMTGESASPPAHIVGIEVMPSGARTTRGSDGDKLDLKPNEVAIFVSLQDLENVPQVLLVGQRIGFIVPADLKYAEVVPGG